MVEMLDDTAGPPAGRSRGTGPSRKGVLAGFWAALPMLIAVIPFGLIFGAVAREAGLDVLETMAFTVIVVAGAAQLVALQMLDEHAPVIVAVLAGAAVNLRMAMYSAAIAPHWRGASTAFRVVGAYFLHDQSFGLTAQRHARDPDEPLADRLGFFLGVGTLTVSFWMGSSLVGAVLGARLPEGWGLGFAVPVCFLAIAAPMIRGAGHLAAAVTGVLVALAASGLPWNLGVMLAAVAGITAGVVVERRTGG